MNNNARGPWWDSNEFGAWLDRLQALCTRFLNVEHAAVERLSDDELWASFSEGLHPIEHLCHQIIPTLEVDFGLYGIEAMVADNILWGGKRR